jgi:hypothetical protein
VNEEVTECPRKTRRGESATEHGNQVDAREQRAPMIFVPVRFMS